MEDDFPLAGDQGNNELLIETCAGKDGTVEVRVKDTGMGLPDEADEPQIVKNDSDSDPVMRLAVTSTQMNPAEVTDYIERFNVGTR